MGTIRNYMRAARKVETAARKSGEWGEWDCIKSGDPEFETSRHLLGAGWTKGIDKAFRVGALPWLVVMVRPHGDYTHAIIRQLENKELGWAEKQKIKNELFGPDRFAVEVYPSEARKIDDSDVYHLWVYPEGYSPPFGLHDNDGNGRDNV